jgi:hypothetical protein
MDQMQQNTTAHLVLDNLIGMEDTEEMHKVKRMKLKNEKYYSSYLNMTYGLNTTMCTRIQSQYKQPSTYGLTNDTDH